MAAGARWESLSSQSPSGEQDTWTWPRQGGHPAATGTWLSYPLAFARPWDRSPQLRRRQPQLPPGHEAARPPARSCSTGPWQGRGRPPTRKNILCCRPFLVSLCRQPSRMNSCKTATRSLGVGPGPRSRWRLAGRLASLSPLTLLRAPLQEPRCPHALCALHPPPSCLLLPASRGLAGCQRTQSPDCLLGGCCRVSSRAGCAEGCRVE